MPIDALPDDLEALRALVNSLSSERDAAIEECRRVIASECKTIVEVIFATRSGTEEVVANWLL